MGPRADDRDKSSERHHPHHQARRQHHQQHHQDPKTHNNAGGRQRGYAVREPQNKRSRDDYDDYDYDYDRDRRYSSEYGKGKSSDYYGPSDEGPQTSRRDESYYGRDGGGDRRSKSSGEGGSRNRSSSRDHGSQNGDGSDWKCRECSTWNYPDENRCYRCGLAWNNKTPRNEKKKHAPLSDSSSNGSNDEYGRRKSSNKKSKKPKCNDSSEWPPSFQKSSERFVLDARSGMFYDAESDFFYDPTSKLYYGNKKHAYFSYNAGTKKFVLVASSGQEGSEGNPAPPAGSSAAGVMEQDHLLLVPNASSKTGAEPPRKVIAINLKSAAVAKKPEKKNKKLPNDTTSTTIVKQDGGSGDGAVAPNPVKPANKLQKQHAAYMEKWSERGKELQQEETETFHQPFDNKPAPSGATARLTAEGKPVCWVCKRKFPTLEKLGQHEEKSALHKENLAKQQHKSQQQQPQDQEEAAKARTTEEHNSKYVDRAQQRRNLYGPELILPPPASSLEVGPSLFPQNDQDEPNSSMVDGSTNIGHQMLRKLGWKSGTTLGRGSEQQQEQQAALAQDWNRIECLAAKNQTTASRRYQS